MSIVLVAFEGAPSVCEEAVQKERELDEKIEQKIKGTVMTNDLHDFSSELVMIMVCYYFQFYPFMLCLWQCKSSSYGV